MGVIYTVPYKDEFNQQCRVDILHAPFSGSTTVLRAAVGQACIITHDSGEDPTDPIVNSKASITLIQEESLPIDIFQLQLAQDREFEIEFYIMGELKWKGFMVPDGIHQTFQSAPFDVAIEATDGLSLLSDIPYSHNNLEGGRCVINYLRQILFSNLNLRLPLPISWAVQVTNDTYPAEADVFSGSVKWSPYGEGFTDFNGNYKDCGYILEGLLRAFQCRIKQSDGQWKIWRNPDVATGVFSTRTIGATLVGFAIMDNPVTSVIRNISGEFDSGYHTIEEDALLDVLPALKTVNTTYKQDQRENVIPNGSMDLVNIYVNKPYFWVMAGSLAGAAGYESVPSLYQDNGNAVQVTGSPSGAVRFMMEAPLPIDADVLYTYINIGFKFSPISGFTLNEIGVIDWTTMQFAMAVTYADNNGQLWYLNEFGFWTQDSFLIPISVPNLKEGEVAQVDFNKFQNIILILPANIPLGRTNEPTLKVEFYIPDAKVIAFDDVYINVQQNSDVYGATEPLSTNTKVENYELNISSAHSGFYVSNLMSDYSQSGMEKFYSDNKAAGVTLTELNSIVAMRHRYLPSLIYRGSIYSRKREYAEIYNIINLTPRKFLPLRSVWNTETNSAQVDLVEIRDDNVQLEINHYGTQDNNSKLSN